MDNQFFFWILWSFQPRHARSGGGILEGFNTTFNSLIPKKNDPHTYYDFKPISLCNCIYKIVENVIDQRLKVVLLKNNSKEQFGFVVKLMKQ